MVNSSSARIEQTWNDPGLDRLVEDLREQGVAVSLSQIIDAGRLLRRLAEADWPLKSRDELGPKLRPIFCKSPDALVGYQKAFETWVKRPPEGRWVSPSVPPEAAKPNAPRRRSYISMLIACLIALYVGDKLVEEIRLSWDRSAVVQPAVPVQQKIAPAERATEKGNYSRSDDQPTAAELPRVYGYFPVYRYYEVLRPVLAWSLLLAPLLLSALGLVLMRSRIGLWLDRGTGQSGTRLTDWPQNVVIERLVPPLAPGLSSRLDRHLTISSDNPVLLARRPRLDVSRTAEATLRNGGLLVRRFREQRIRPSYLILVDERHDDAMLVLWARRWLLRGLDVDVRRLLRTQDQVRAPCGWRILRASRGDEQTPLDGLPDPIAAQRLVLVGGFPDLLDEQGEWQPWSRRARLWRWSERAFFTTTEFRYWGDVEENLGRTGGMTAPGFFVLPFDDGALSAWSIWLIQGRLPEIDLSTPERYPRLLQQDTSGRFMRSAAELATGERPLEPKEVKTLLTELQLYLGENGFYWLCCCAIPPVIDPKLIYLLGAEYFTRAGRDDENWLRVHLSRVYPRLARLPWIRDCHLPDWLRMALLVRLPTSVQAEVRSVVEGLLSWRTPMSTGDPEPSSGTVVGVRSEPTDAAQHQDAFSVGFSSGLNARDLMLRVPGEWKKWLADIVPRRTPFAAVREQLTALFARATYRDGIKESGVARLPLLVTSVASLACVIALVVLGSTLPTEWGEPWHSFLFVDQLIPVVMKQPAAVVFAAFSRDGKRMVTVSDDASARIWDPRTGAAIGRPMYHLGKINSASFSADGRRIVTASNDKTVRVWDATTGSAIGRPFSLQSAALAAVFNPNGKRVLTGSAGLVQLWDIDRGVPIAGISTDPYPPLMNLSPDGVHALLVHGDLVRIADVESQSLGTPVGVGGAARVGAFSPDGKRVVVTTSDGIANVWEVATGQVLSRTLNGDPLSLYAAFSSDGNQLLTCSSDGKMAIRDATSGKLTGDVFSVPLGFPSSIAFSPDGRALLIRAGGVTSVHFFSTDSRQEVGTPIIDRAIEWAGFAPDGRVVTTGDDGIWRIWEARAGVSASPPMTSGGSVSSASFSPDGHYVATANTDGTARIWDASTGRALGKPIPSSRPLNRATFSPDGTTVLTATNDSSVRLWNAKTQAPVGVAMVHELPITAASFSADGKYVVTGSMDSTARVWDAATGRTISTFLKHDSGVIAVAFSPDGSRVVTGSYDGTARIWDSTTGASVGAVLTHDQAVTAVDFSPDGSTVVTTSLDRKARLWNSKTGALLNTTEPHAAAITRVSFSPDGKSILTTSEDRTARLWRVPDAKSAVPPMVHEGGVATGEFSPDGLTIVTASEDATVRLWDLHGKLLGVIPTSGAAADARFHPKLHRVLVAQTRAGAQIFRIAPLPDDFPIPTDNSGMQTVFFLFLYVIGFALAPVAAVVAVLLRRRKVKFLVGVRA